MKRKKKKSCAKGGKLQPENLHQTLSIYHEIPFTPLAEGLVVCWLAEFVVCIIANSMALAAVGGVAAVVT